MNLTIDVETSACLAESGPSSAWETAHCWALSVCLSLDLTLKVRKSKIKCEISTPNP